MPRRAVAAREERHRLVHDQEGGHEEEGRQEEKGENEEK